MEPAKTETKFSDSKETCISLLEMPGIPATNDVQRLLAYIYQVVPSFTRMKLSYQQGQVEKQILRNDLVSLQQSYKLLEWNLKEEKEKAQFIEQYASRVVKERNHALHQNTGVCTRIQQEASTSSSNSSSRRMSSLSKSSWSHKDHFVWHSCCRKNAHKDSDVDQVPSIASLRGEKLQEAFEEIRALKSQTENYKFLLDEAEKKLVEQRCILNNDQDVCKKFAKDLELQVTQRSVAHSTLEKKFEAVRNELLGLKSLHATQQESLEKLQIDCENYTNEKEQLLKKIAEKDEQIKALTEGCTNSRDMMDKLNTKLRVIENSLVSKDAEIDSLQSEIQMLQNQDINEMIGRYKAKLDETLRNQELREHEYQQTIDSLRSKLEEEKTHQVQSNIDLDNELDNVEDFPITPEQMSFLESNSTRSNDSGNSFDASPEHAIDDTIPATPFEFCVDESEHEPEEEVWKDLFDHSIVYREDLHSMEHSMTLYRDPEDSDLMPSVDVSPIKSNQLYQPFVDSRIDPHSYQEAVTPNQKWDKKLKEDGVDIQQQYCVEDFAFEHELQLLIADAINRREREERHASSEKALLQTHMKKAKP